MQRADVAWRIVRCLYGLCLLALTAFVIVRFGGNHPSEAKPAAGDFTGALNRSGFMNPLLTASLLAGGAALLRDRWAPVGLLLVAPAIGVIGLFHWFLTGDYLWGSIWPAWWLALAWHYRRVFARLWSPDPG